MKHTKAIIISVLTFLLIACSDTSSKQSIHKIPNPRVINYPNMEIKNSWVDSKVQIYYHPGQVKEKDTLIVVL